MVILGVQSCRKGDPFGIIQSDNPPPGIQNVRDYSISEFEDTIALRFRFNSFSDIVYERYSYAWTCIRKPDGVDAPTIVNGGKPEATAYGLKPGVYQFKIQATNKKGQSSESFQVTVMEDTLRGKTIIIPDQTWIVLDSVTTIGTVTWVRWNPKLITAPKRPDLFFRKLSGMYISYRNEGENEWKKLDGFEQAILLEETFWSKLPNAPESWKALHGKKADVRIYFR
jgi:hypothetical protein